MRIPKPFFAISLGILYAFAPAARATPADPIRAVLDAQVAGWNRGDIDGFMNGYARSAKTAFVAGDKVRYGWQTVRDGYAKKYNTRQKMGRLVFSGLTIEHLCADAAMVLGSWKIERKSGELHGKFTLLFRNLPEGWRIVLDHTS